MRVYFSILLGVLLLPPGSARAQGVEVYVVHAINGMDLGLSEAVPVDVAVDGSCAITSFEFKDIVGPVELAAGSHAVSVRLSDGACGGAEVIAADIELEEHAPTSIVAHLDLTGAPTASLFSNRQGYTAEDFGKIIVRHVANAPTVDITLRPSGDPQNPGVAFADLRNGRQAGVALSAGAWRARIFPTGSTDVLVGPVATPVRPDQVLIVYAVGSLEPGTFDLVTQTLELLPRPGQ